MIYSGVDWSQEVGGPILVIAAAFIDASELDRLDKELAQVRVQIRKGPDYPFKHVHAQESTRRLFYPALCRIPSLEAHVLILDTVTWIDQFKSVKVQRGDTRVCHAMATLVAECPDHLIEGHIMRIEIPKEEVKTVAAYRTALRNALKMARKPTIKDMRPCPDDRRDGAIVQVADMIACQVREDPELSGVHLRAIAHKITLV